jgi:hypothetical protein
MPDNDGEVKQPITHAQKDIYIGYCVSFPLDHFYLLLYIWTIKHYKNIYNGEVKNKLSPTPEKSQTFKY